MIARLLRPVATLALLFSLSFLTPAWGGGHGDGGAPAAPLGFVVNLASAAGDRFLKLDIVLETAGPEVAKEVAALMPRILHRVILLLSGETDEALRTLAGKHELADKIRSTVNKIIHEDEESGIKEVLFTTFLIQ